MRPRPIKAVLFDLDGTLFDRDTSVRRLVEKQYEVLSPALAVVPKAAFVARFMQLDARGYVRKDEVYRRLLQEFEIKDLDATTLFDYFLAHYHDHCLAFPYTAETLAQLQSQGRRLGIITNGGYPFQRRTVQALSIEGYFSAVLVSGAEGVRKPDPVIFQMALDRLGVAPSEAVFVGDHPVVDVEGAHGAGLKAIWKRDDFWPAPDEADGIIDELNELPKLVDRLEAEL